MPDEPPQAIHGLLSAYPGRDDALAIRCRGFVVGKRSAEVYAKVSRVLAAGGRDQRAMDGARPSQDRMSCRGKSETRQQGRGGSQTPRRFFSSCLPQIGEETTKKSKEMGLPVNIYERGSRTHAFRM